MPDLEPITREEMLWSGEDIEPITREEMYIKHIFDKTQTIPSKPITRKEMLLEKAGEGGGSDVTIKQLSVTANGTYSEENTAYSPVIVNVPAPPIPDNAYLLNELSGLPADIATFTDGSNLPMPSLKVGIEPIQSGSGDPSPSNVRPISGWTEANLTVADDVDNPTVTHTTTIPFLDSQGNPVEVFGGECDVVNGGEQPSTYLKWTLTPTVSQIASVGINDCLISIPDNKMPIDWNVNVNNCMCDKLKVSNYSAQHDNHVHFPNSSIIALYLEDEVGTTKQEWVDYLAQAQITVCYKVATPSTFYTQPTSIKSIEGVNNVWADTGEIEELEYFSKEA